MAERIKIQPARKGLVVRDPETMRPLDPGGEFKPRNSYWLRRLTGGDVQEVRRKKSGGAGNNS